MDVIVQVLFYNGIMVIKMTVENKIKVLLKNNNYVVVAIDGPSGSGKSTYAEKLATQFDGLVIHMDDYFLPKEMKTEERLNEIAGNVHIERFMDEIIPNLKNDVIPMRKFDCMKEQYSDEILLKNKKVIIIEGCYSMHPKLHQFYDLKILLQITGDLQIERIKKRSGEFMLQRFIKEWIPLENAYFEGVNIQKIVDIIIHNY